MIRLIFIVIAFLMMVGAVVCGLYFWGVDPLAKLGLVLGKVPEKEINKPVIIPPTYVDFGLLIVPVIQGREVKNQAEMILRLEVPANRKELIALNLPRLQAAFLEDMMGYMPILLRDGNGLDAAAIRRRLVGVSERVLGPGMVKDVVIEHAALK